MIQLQITKEDLDYDSGKGIEIKVPGFNNNPTCPDEPQIYVEYYDGKLRVHAWNGKEDPDSLLIDPLEE